MSANPNTDTNKAPSMLAGHAQYAKGYVEETIGNATSSPSWQASGKADASAGLAEMKAASAQQEGKPAASGLGGKVEELAGRVAGCEGMEKEGAERQEKAS